MTPSTIEFSDALAASRCRDLRLERPARPAQRFVPAAEASVRSRRRSRLSVESPFVRAQNCVKNILQFLFLLFHVERRVSAALGRLRVSAETRRTRLA